MNHYQDERSLASDILATIALTLALVMFCYADLLQGEERLLLIGTKPAKCATAPCALTLRVLAKPDAENEKIVLAWSNVLDSDYKPGELTYDRVSDVEVEFELPQGYYEFTATLYRKGEAVYKADKLVAVGMGVPGIPTIARFGKRQALP